MQLLGCMTACADLKTRIRDRTMKLVVQMEEADLDKAVKNYLAARGLVAVNRPMMEEIAAYNCMISSVSSGGTIKWHIYYDAATDTYNRR